jgi:FkbM family methyltransferase
MIYKTVDKLMIKNIIKSVFLKNGNISYSQCGEDLIIQFIFNEMRIKNPTYLDIGTHHPTYINNTYLFYRNKNYGVCVEPEPYSFNIIKKVRPKDICLNIGIGVENQNFANFYVLSSKSLNTFSKETAEEYVKESGQIIEEILKIPLCPINDIIRQYFPNCPNLISLDAEGLDFQIIQSFNFQKYRPEILCIETISYSTKNTETKNHELIHFLESKGYFVYADTYINTIFVDKEKWIKRG